MNNTSNRLLLGAALAAAFTASSTPVLAQSAPTTTAGSKWESSAGLGFTLSTGNSETLLGTADFNGTKKWDAYEWIVGANLTYGENDGLKNADSQRVLTQLNWLVSARTYAYGRVELSRDTIADIDYRVPISVGLGYYFIKEKDTFLSAEVGPGFVLEKKGGKSDSYMTLRGAERFEHKFNENVKLWQSLEITPQIDDFDNFQVVGEIGIEAKLSKALALRTYLQDTYVNKPAAGRKDNDAKVVTAIAYKF
jgi:putative salt-induced outer membrane protein